jgi:hypothetical protein
VEERHKGSLTPKNTKNKIAKSTLLKWKHVDAKSVTPVKILHALLWDLLIRHVHIKCPHLPMKFELNLVITFFQSVSIFQERRQFLCRKTPKIVIITLNPWPHWPWTGPRAWRRGRARWAGPAASPSSGSATRCWTSETGTGSGQTRSPGWRPGQTPGPRSRKGRRGRRADLWSRDWCLEEHRNRLTEIGNGLIEYDWTQSDDFWHYWLHRFEHLILILI